MTFRITLLYMLFTQGILFAQTAWLENGTYQIVDDRPADEINPELKIVISGEKCTFYNGGSPLVTTVEWLPDHCFRIPGYTFPISSENVPENVLKEPKPFIRLVKKQDAFWYYQMELPGDSIPILKGKLIKI